MRGMVVRGHGDEGYGGEGGMVMRGHGDEGYGGEGGMVMRGMVVKGAW